ncbi:hypothetical protein HDU92_002993 [Lobulomyces angularis]|nr:hypothetical protein HDU92_002993 [Lobulomyces angularis]
MVAELAAKQRHFEQSNDDAETRNRTQLEEINNLRYRLEGFALRANEATTEVRATAHELDLEQQRAAENFRAIKDHDHALDVLHNSVESKSDALKRNMDLTAQDIRQRIDVESRNRVNFENNIKELYSDVRKVISNQERSLLDRIDSNRQITLQTVDKERQDRERSMAAVMENMRNWEKAVKETESQIIARVTEQLSNLEAKFNEDHNHRAKFEGSLRSDVEDGFRIIQQSLAKRGSELTENQNELKQRVVNAVKTLQESIILVEKTSEAKFNNYEQVLRAEIKSRMDIEIKMSQTVESLDEKLLEVQKAVIEQLDITSDELKAENKSIIEEISKTAEQLTQSKTRAVEDLESQIQQVSKRIKDDEFNTKETEKLINIKIESLQREYQEAIEASETKFETKLCGIKDEENDIRVKMSDTQIMFQDVKNSILDKFNIKSVQMDQTLEAFKEDLRLKLSIKDGDDLESRIKTQISSIFTSVGHLVQSNSNIKDELELRATKKELDEYDGKGKASISLINTKIVQINEDILKCNEDVATRATKKELLEVEDKQKLSTMELQVEDSKLLDLINELKEELSDRVFKKQLEEIEIRIKNQLSLLSDKENDLNVNIVNLRSELKTKASKEEVRSTETKITSNLDNVIESLNLTVDELKTNLEKQTKETYDQWGVAFGKLSSQVSTVELKADGLNTVTEGIKLKISDNEKILRSQIKEAMQSQESVLNAELLLLEKIKEETQNQIKEVNIKIEDIPRTLHYNDMQYAEFKRYIAELLQKEQEKTTYLLTELRESLQHKVSEQDFDKVQGELHGNIQKINSKIEIEELSIDQIRNRIQEIESQARERLREIRSFQERESGDMELKSRQERDLNVKKFEEIELKLKNIPKQIEISNNELRNLKFKFEENFLQVEFLNLKKDFINFKNELGSKITKKNFDDNIELFQSEMRRKFDTLNTRLNEIKNSQDIAKFNNIATSEKDLKELSPFYSTDDYKKKMEEKNTTNYSSNLVTSTSPQPQLIPGSFFKPTHLNLKKEEEPNVQKKEEMLLKKNSNTINESYEIKPESKSKEYFADNNAMYNIPKPPSNSQLNNSSITNSASPRPKSKPTTPKSLSTSDVAINSILNENNKNTFSMNPLNKSLDETKISSVNLSSSSKNLNKSLELNKSLTNLSKSSNELNKSVNSTSAKTGSKNKSNLSLELIEKLADLATNSDLKSTVIQLPVNSPKGVDSSNEEF